jgi:hypothetical protein
MSKRPVFTELEDATDEHPLFSPPLDARSWAVSFCRLRIEATAAIFLFG